MDAIAHYQSNGGALLTSFEYLHPDNAVGEPHRITKTDSTGAKSFIELQYDDALRIKSETYYDGDPTDAIADVLTRTISYTYDDAGNRTSVTEDFVTEEYEIDATSGYKITATGGDDGLLGTTGDNDTYGYDDGGRLTDIVRDGHDWDLSYNAAGQVTSITRNGPSTLAYQYDALGRRTQASVGSTTTEFLIAPAAQRLGAGALDVEQLHLATDGSGSLLQGWVYAGENPILRYDSSGNVQYYLEDATDSIAALVEDVINPTSTDVTEYEFDAFGNVLNGQDPTSAAGGDFGFHAAWRDNETGLYHMRARSYDPETGRFLSVDPATPNEQVPETYHPYAFANNNPHLFSDPTGLFSVVEINVSQAIQSNLSRLKAAVVQKAREEAIEELESFASEFFAEQLTALIPAIIPDFANGVIKAGIDFESKVEKAFAKIFGEPFRGYLWFQPNIEESTGKVRRAGISARDLFSGKRNRSTVSSRPDYLINPDNPTSPDADLTWLVGDFSISAQTLYNKYIKPGKQIGQWNAITNHAESYGLRLSAFFTFHSATRETSNALRDLMIKEGFEDGTLVFILSFSNSKKARLSWTQ